MTFFVNYDTHSAHHFGRDRFVLAFKENDGYAIYASTSLNGDTGVKTHIFDSPNLELVENYVTGVKRRRILEHFKHLELVKNGGKTGVNLAMAIKKNKVSNNKIGLNSDINVLDSRKARTYRPGNIVKNDVVSVETGMNIETGSIDAILGNVTRSENVVTSEGILSANSLYSLSGVKFPVLKNTEHFLFDDENTYYIYENKNNVLSSIEIVSYDYSENDDNSINIENLHIEYVYKGNKYGFKVNTNDCSANFAKNQVLRGIQKTIENI